METNPVEQYIARQQPPLQPLLQKVRALIKETAPELTESLKWGYPSYGNITQVCYLAAQTKHLNLGFYHGSQLPDPDKLLEGTGAQMRHIKIRKEADIRPEAFKKLIGLAKALQK